MADTAKDGLARFQAQQGGIKIAIIDGTMPGSTEMASLLRRSLPDSHAIVLRDHRQPEVLPRLLLNLL
jgi:DNA-binding NarL/FixJ family response regulator